MFKNRAGSVHQAVGIETEISLDALTYPVETLLTLCAETYHMYAMKLPNLRKPARLLAAVLVLLTLQATGQVAQQSRSDHPPTTQTGNGAYNVWIPLDVLHNWMSAENGVANFSSDSSFGLYRDLAGVWTSAEIPGLVLTLQADGNFALATSANPEQRCAAGIERGNWAVSEETGELRFHTKTDTSGKCGLSDIHNIMTIRLADTGLLLAIHEPDGSDHEVSLVRHEK